MKRHFLFAAALLSVPVVAATAQAPAPTAQVAMQDRHHATPHKAAVRMGRELNLSADQQARLEPILAERRQKVAVVRANTELSPADRHHQLKVIRKQARTEMTGVLSPDQMQQLRAMHKARHAAGTPTGV